ncbi:MAG: helix-turn-helix domain-containing protein [Clostridiales bacterium]|nr:helix-turn-helix domain-containing protein [Clostridiales bacterium]
MDNLSIFGERINEYIILAGGDVVALSKEMEISDTTLYALKRGENLPTARVLYKLLQRFHCSADYLLGLVDDYEEKQYPNPTENFSSRFANILKECQVSQYALTKEHNISGHLLYQWLHGQSIPSASNLIKLSKILQVSVNYLIGLEN